jgi:hypothetical protein
MNLTPNLFPLPTWAPAFQRVPTPLAELNRAFLCGERACQATQLSAEEAAALPPCVGGGGCLSSHGMLELIAAPLGARFVQTVITGFDRE